MKDLFILKYVIFLMSITSCDVVVAQTLEVDTLFNHIYEGGECLQGCQIVKIGQNVKEIPSWAFAICPTLQKVIFHSGVDSIGDNAFFSCKNLVYANFRDVSFVGENAFKQTALERADLANAKQIGDFAFSRCGKLRRVKFSRGLESIGDFSFSEDSCLVVCDAIDGGVGQSAFMGCHQLRSVSFRSRTKKIGKAAFLNCHMLKRVSLPPHLKSIEAMTFMNCFHLKGVSIPKEVTRIEASAFQGTGLKKIVIPSSVGYIGHLAFADWQNLKMVIVNNPHIVIEEDAFDEQTNIIIN